MEEEEIPLTISTLVKKRKHYTISEKLKMVQMGENIGPSKTSKMTGVQKSSIS